MSPETALFIFIILVLRKTLRNAAEDLPVMPDLPGKRLPCRPCRSAFGTVRNQAVCVTVASGCPFRKFS
jgi:hypothetical protein